MILANFFATYPDPFHEADPDSDPGGQNKTGENGSGSSTLHILPRYLRKCRSPAPQWIWTARSTSVALRSKSILNGLLKNIYHKIVFFLNVLSSL